MGAGGNTAKIVKITVYAICSPMTHFKRFICFQFLWVLLGTSIVSAEQSCPLTLASIAAALATKASVEEVPTNIWRQYALNRKNQVLRDQIWAAYHPLVLIIAGKMALRLPTTVLVEDLAQDGEFGLLDAMENFDPERGVKFKTYASPRIHGAIVDALRNADWVPRLVRSRAAKLQKVIKKFKQQHSREPTDEELAEVLDKKVIKDGRPLGMGSLEYPVSEFTGEKDAFLRDLIEDTKTELPEQPALRQALKEELLKGLSRREKIILELYYYQGMTMEKIGRKLHLSETMISVLHKSLLQRLRTRLQALSE